ncbi:MAG: M20/M25/M40 family metallo-hydrolase [Bacteroidota bacterium]
MNKILLLLTLTTSFKISSAQLITEAKIKKHITYLASDKLQGREPGTKGEQLAYQYIQKQFKRMDLLPKGSDGYLQNFTYKTLASPHDTIGLGKQKNGTNVVGYLDNNANYTIVIGGHYDHLGYDEHPSSLDKNKKLIHNGADDNASGTAGVIELANYFVNNDVKEKYNFLFICFSGEEDGLIGSKYYVNNPTINLNTIQCMINMDMVGRLNDSTKKVMVYGVGTSPGYSNAFANLTTPLTLTFDSSGIGPSDQTSFYLKDIPVLHFFTGQHSDYHKSSDDTEKINYAGEKLVLDLIAAVTEKLADQPKLTFTKTKQPEQQRVSFKVTLGIMPDYTFEGIGLKIDAVNEGKPAEKAGLLSGDIITEMGAVKIENIYDYMKALGTFKKGETSTIVITRNKNKMQFNLTF